MAEVVGLFASFVGILAVSVKLYGLCAAAREVYRTAPVLLQETEAEVRAVEDAVQSIQRLFLCSEDSEVAVHRQSLELTMTHCVLTFSRLERLLLEFSKRPRSRPSAAAFFVRKNGELRELLGRLQWEKLSLILTLQIATSKRQEEQRTLLAVLEDKINQGLANDAVMASRLLAIVDDADLSCVCRPPSPEPVFTGRKSFESILERAFPYRRRDGSEEILDDSSSNVRPSICIEGISMCKVSMISTFALPLCIGEIENSQSYQITGGPHNEDSGVTPAHDSTLTKSDRRTPKDPHKSKTSRGRRKPKVIVIKGAFEAPGSFNTSTSRNRVWKQQNDGPQIEIVFQNLFEEARIMNQQARTT